MAEKITGGCLCGAVRYEITGDQIFSGKCYCNDCRRASGTGHSSVLAVPDQAFKLTGKVTKFEKAGGSGQPITRSFCPICGSRITSVASVMPGVTMVLAGTLDEPEKFVSQMSVYASRAPTWDRPPEGSVTFPEMPPPQPH